ncbi:MAG: TIGR00730 family Rossman fold protein [Bacillota bacterium]
MNKVICVYSSSSSEIDRTFMEAAAELGRQIAFNNDVMLFGGGMNGLMGATAKAVHGNGGKVIGIIPEALNINGVVYERCDELIVTKGMRERKALMDSRSDAFIALPGGFGTLEEILEIITLKQLQYHNKPVVILNINSFFKPLVAFFEQIITQNFAKPESRRLYFVTEQIKEALDYIDNYQPCQFSKKWLNESSRTKE